MHELRYLGSFGCNDGTGNGLYIYNQSIVAKPQAPAFDASYL